MAFMLMAMIFIMLPRANVSALRIMEVLEKKIHILTEREKKALQEREALLNSKM